jgi:hypothetical protein
MQRRIDNIYGVYVYTCQMLVEISLFTENSKKIIAASATSTRDCLVATQRGIINEQKAGNLVQICKIWGSRWLEIPEVGAPLCSTITQAPNKDDEYSCIFSSEVLFVLYSSNSCLPPPSCCMNTTQPTSSFLVYVSTQGHSSSRTFR